MIFVSKWTKFDFMATTAPIVESPRKTKRNLAPKIRKMAMRYPELGKTEIARRVGCSPANVTGVLKSFLNDKSMDDLADFRDNKAEAMEAVQLRILASVTDAKIEKANAVQAVTAVAILEDKIRLTRGQATNINVSVLMDVADAMRVRNESYSGGA